MIKKIQISNRADAEQVLHIQIPAYQTEAVLIEFEALPPLFDSVESLQNCGETFYGFYSQDELCGVISWKTADRMMDIHRLFVHPAHFKKGIAGKLLKWAIHSAVGLDTIQVSTGTENIPAVCFYQKYDFTVADVFVIPEGLSITVFQLDLPA